VECADEIVARQTIGDPLDTLEQEALDPLLLGGPRGHGQRSGVQWQHDDRAGAMARPLGAVDDVRCDLVHRCIGEGHVGASAATACAPSGYSLENAHVDPRDRAQTDLMERQ
jgi:hypothetical protein